MLKGHNYMIFTHFCFRGWRLHSCVLLKLVVHILDMYQTSMTTNTPLIRIEHLLYYALNFIIYFSS